jgi:O-succinylbenzoic acid--CoA ligase
MTSGHLGVDPASDRWLCCLPISHIGGLSVITRALLTGTPVSVHDRFDPDDVMKSVREDGVTRTSLVTRALRRIDARPFTSILLGGAAPPADRPANVIATYGSTETGSGVVYDRRPLEGVELRIDRSGQLWVRSPTLLRCYRDGVDPKDPDGWFPTGDAAVIGADGDLVVAGRAAEVIVTGGEKVWPSRIEPLIAALSSVAGVAVIGRPHPEWGHEVVAVVEPADPSTPPTIDEIKEVVRSVLPPRWAPRRVELVRSLPRTPLGKIRRDAL